MFINQGNRKAEENCIWELCCTNRVWDRERTEASISLNDFAQGYFLTIPVALGDFFVVFYSSSVSVVIFSPVSGLWESELYPLSSIEGLQSKEE